MHDKYKNVYCWCFRDLYCFIQSYWANKSHQLQADWINGTDWFEMALQPIVFKCENEMTPHQRFEWSRCSSCPFSFFSRVRELRFWLSSGYSSRKEDEWVEPRSGRTLSRRGGVLPISASRLRLACKRQIHDGILNRAASTLLICVTMSFFLYRVKSGKVGYSLRTAVVSWLRKRICD